MNIVLEDLKKLIEAFVFSQPDPVSEKAIQGLLENNSIVLQKDGCETVSIHAVLLDLQKEYAHRGIHLCQIAGGWQFRTAQEWSSYFVRLIPRPRRLSRAMMETLAVIAYHQPCTRADIEKIRGVGLGQAIVENLLEYGLIRPCGHKPVPGRPILWGTTKEFLFYLGLNDLHDLPRREELFGDMPYQSDAEK